MDKLIKVIALDNEFISTGERFCTKGKEYSVTEQDENGYYITSEAGKNHYFEYDDPYFELVFQNNNNEIYSKRISQDLLEYRKKIRKRLESLQVELDEVMSMI